MIFSDFIGLTEKERREQSPVILGERWKEPDKIAPLLEEIYEVAAGSKSLETAAFSLEEALLCAGASLYLESGELRERALLALYYLVEERDREEERHFLREYCSDAAQESDEGLRGRKHWVSLRHLSSEGEVNDRIESYVRRMRGEEDSPYVWERVFAVLQIWSESFRLYPEMETWGIPIDREGDPYWSLVRKTGRRHVKSLRGDSRIRSGLEEWTACAMTGNFPYDRLSWVYENYGSTGSDFPLSPDAFFRLYTGSESQGRVVLLSYLGEYLSEGAWPKSRTYRSIVEETEVNPKDIYERASLLLLEAYSFLKGERPEAPFARTLEFLATPFPAHADRSEVYHGVTASLTPVLLRFLIDASVPLEDVSVLADLFCHSSEYIRASGASLVLQAVRSGYDIRSMLPDLENSLSENPESTNALASGKDIEQEEFEISFDLPSPKGFLQAPGEGFSAKEKDGDEGFFNLGNLTGLLESCKPPFTAYRLALALREYAEKRRDERLKTFLVKFAEVNAALEGLEWKPNLVSEPETESGSDIGQGATASSLSPVLEMERDSVQGKKSGRDSIPLRADSSKVIPRRQVGPLYLPEILDMLEQAVEGAADAEEAKQRAERIAKERAVSIEDRYSAEVQSVQRQLIKQVFESPGGGNPGKNQTESGLFTSIFDRMRSMGAQAIPLCNGSILESIDASEPHPDLLACYIPRYDTGKTEEHRYGIYFFINRIIDLLFVRGLPREALLRTVAVHELFHAHMNERLPEGGRSHSHSGEKPPYCRLEEAAANRVALTWLRAAGFPETVAESIEIVLFAPYSGPGSKGLPGYGEYGKLDDDVPQLLPDIISNSPRHIEVDRYAVKKSLYQWGFSPRRRNSLVWWNWLVEEIDRGSVPMYFDLECGRY